MKKNILLTLLLVSLIAAAGVYGQTPSGAPTLAIFVFNQKVDDRFLTDILRTEIFKTKIFRIMERTVVDQALENQKIKLDGQSDSSLMNLGRAMKIEKLMICSMEKYGGSLAANVRIVDVGTNLIEYTENLILQDEKQLLSGLKDLVVKMSLFYNSKNNPDMDISPAKQAEILMQNWLYLNASENDLVYLMEREVAPDDYMDLRQYDVNFTVGQYVKLKRSGLDLGRVRAFLLEGIPFSQVEKAMALGITKLDKYKTDFARFGVSFEQYLLAYEKNITTLSEYRDFMEGYVRDFMVVGLGGVADQFPLANSEFAFLVGQVAWEHYFSKYQRDPVKYSLESGFYFMSNGNFAPAPVPYAQFNFYWGERPYYLKMAVGGHAEVLMGGHFGLNFKLGLEIDEEYEVSFMVVPIGTQPRVSYVDLTTPVKNGEGGILFPYVGAFFSMKL